MTKTGERILIAGTVVSLLAVLVLSQTVWAAKEGKHNLIPLPGTFTLFDSDGGLVGAVRPFWPFPDVHRGIHILLNE